MDFPDGSSDKESPYNTKDVGDRGLIPGSGRSPREGNGKPLQYSCLENSMDKTSLAGHRVHRVKKSQIPLGTHSFIHWYTCTPSILNPSPTSLPTVSLQGQPIPVFFPGKPRGQRSLAGCSPWCLKELDTTE